MTIEQEKRITARWLALCGFRKALEQIAVEMAESMHYPEPADEILARIDIGGIESDMTSRIAEHLSMEVSNALYRFLRKQGYLGRKRH